MHLIYRLYPLAIVATLAGGATWLEIATRDTSPPGVKPTAQTVDYVVSNVSIRAFSAEGTLAYTLDSPSLTHYQSTDITQFEKPELHLFKPDQRVSVNADKGEVAPKGKQVDLTGSVLVTREAPGTAPMRLNTRALTIWPEEQRAESKVSVVMTQGTSRAVANYFSADNVFGVLHLTGKVKIQFQR